MLKIDNTLLVEIGLGGLPETEKNSFLKHIYETLEMRVGIRLADQMTNEQLDEFERYFEAKDDAGAFKWLETNFPNYKDIVQQEFDKLKAEVAQTAPQILAASQAQASAQPPAATEPLAAPQSPVAPQPDPFAQAPQPTVQPAPVQQPATAPQPPQPDSAFGQSFDPVAIAAQPYQGQDQPQPTPAPQPQPFQPAPPPQVEPPAPQPQPQPEFPSQQPPAGPSVS